LTDYEKYNERQSIYNDIKIWEAAWVALEATSFVPLLDLSSRRFKRSSLNGKLGGHNPVHELWQEAAEE
jgi:hypothetical protein